MAELTQQQLSELQKQLYFLKEKLEKLLANSVEHDQPVMLDQSRQGRVSRIDAIQQHQIAKAGRVQNEIQLRNIIRALEMFEAGDYGFCRDCDEFIPFERLKIRPETLFCIQCQSKLEAQGLKL